MTNPEIPAHNRKLPRLMVWILAILFYLILSPLNWLLKKLGKPKALIGFVGKRNINSDRIKKAFAGYAPDSGDIFVCAYSKSGTNWLMQIAHQIAWYGAGEFEHIHDVVAWPDTPPRLGEKMFTPLRSDIIKKLSPTGLRVIKTHLAAHYVPYSEEAKYLVVVRDPKEVLVSSYPFFGSVLGPLMPSVEIWLQMFLEPGWPMGFGNTWAEHTASYWALRDKPNVLILSYSKLKRDPEQGIRQISQTLGVSLNEEQFARVLERSSFSYMKGINHKFSPVEAGSIPWAKDFTMIRSGKSGNSAEMLNEEQQNRIDRCVQEELQRLGSDFPYEDFFK